MIVLVRASTLICPRRGQCGRLLEHVRQRVRLGVRDPLGEGPQLTLELLGLVELAALVGLPLEVAEPGDADDVALEDAAQGVGLEDELEGAAPGTSLSFSVTFPVTPGSRRR